MQRGNSWGSLEIHVITHKSQTHAELGVRPSVSESERSAHKTTVIIPSVNTCRANSQHEEKYSQMFRNQPPPEVYTAAHSCQDNQMEHKAWEVSGMTILQLRHSKKHETKIVTDAVSGFSSVSPTWPTSRNYELWSVVNATKVLLYLCGNDQRLYSYILSPSTTL